MPDTSHISHRAFLRELGILLSILLRILSVSANLMVRVGSGSKRFHALGVLARWVSETTSSCLKGKVGGCWGRGGRTPTPHSTPRALHWAGEVQCWVFLGKQAVLPISGSGASSLGSGRPSALWNCLMLLEGSCLRTDPSLSGCHPCGLQLPDLCSYRRRSESGHLLAIP